ncbi:hypothetical protein OEZ85_004323 [Tetradesmus obliquus]|uniref:Uncharacterized protein n=1 Tax=Tetradesmus obliquus TaxID=3088 RepID=A0ABY8UNW1_TETOB|nr:hypothetical protein OEZ85_004323 [Tetradesmus obliquus]
MHAVAGLVELLFSGMGAFGSTEATAELVLTMTQQLLQSGVLTRWAKLSHLLLKQREQQVLSGPGWSGAKAVASSIS